MGVETLAQRIARLKAEKAAAQGSLPAPPDTPPAPDSVHDADLIPEVEAGYERTEADIEIDRVVDGIGVVEAYVRYIGKMTPKAGRKRESIMVSCPKPDHPDRNPSAWLNSDTDTWFCGTCNEGGDKFDFFAWHFGFPVPGYKEAEKFVALRKRVAEDNGVVTTTDALTGRPKVATVVIEDDETPEPTVAPIEPSAAGTSEPRPSDFPPPGPSVAVIPTALAIEAEDETGDFIQYPTIDWRTIATPPGSFLSRWMEETSSDDLPDEFYFWLGMQAIGFAIGRDTELGDNPHVRGNLFVCLYGGTGMGKSRSTGHLTRLLRDALPYDHDDPTSSGTYLMPNPGSAEALVDAFSKPVFDLTDPKKIDHYAGVRGYVRIDEFSTLAGRSARVGSVMKPTLMEFYDGYNAVELRSRGAGHVVADRHFAQVVTTTQPKAIRDLVSGTDVDSGFINRWIFACGPAKRLESFGRKPIDIAACVPLLQAIRVWSSTRRARPVGLTPEALRLWDDFFRNTLVPAKEEDGLLTRADLTMKKIMLLLAANRHLDEVDAECMTDTIELWTYLRRSYALIQGEIGMGEFEDCHQRITQVIQRFQTKNGKPPTKREIGRLMHRDPFNIEMIGRVLKAMMTLGEVEDVEYQSKKGGPTVTRYKYVD